MLRAKRIAILVMVVFNLLLFGAAIGVYATYHHYPHPCYTH